MANKYQAAKIYKIVSSVIPDVYIGSTTMSIHDRLRHHVNHYNKYKRGKNGFITSFKLIEHENYNVELIEDFPCDSIVDLRKRERFHIENIENCCNKHLPGRTKDEYNKYYYGIHKEKLNNHKAERFQCECGASVRMGDKATHYKTKKHLRVVGE